MYIFLLGCDINPAYQPPSAVHFKKYRFDQNSTSILVEYLIIAKANADYKLRANYIVTLRTGRVVADCDI